MWLANQCHHWRIIGIKRFCWRKIYRKPRKPLVIGASGHHTYFRYTLSNPLIPASKKLPSPSRLLLRALEKLWRIQGLRQSLVMSNDIHWWPKVHIAKCWATLVTIVSPVQGNLTYVAIRANSVSDSWDFWHQVCWVCTRAWSFGGQVPKFGWPKPELIAATHLNRSRKIGVIESREPVFFRLLPSSSTFLYVSTRFNSLNIERLKSEGPKALQLHHPSQHVSNHVQSTQIEQCPGLRKTRLVQSLPNLRITHQVPVVFLSWRWASQSYLNLPSKDPDPPWLQWVHSSMRQTGPAARSARQRLGFGAWAERGTRRLRRLDLWECWMDHPMGDEMGWEYWKKHEETGKKNKSGWWFEPLWKILVNWDENSPIYGENKKWQPNHQPVKTFIGQVVEIQ